MKLSLAIVCCLFFLNIKVFSQTNVMEIPFELIDNRPFIEVIINNSDKTYHFILDCGAINVIDLNLAKELKLTLENHQRIPGVGENMFDSYETSIDSVSFSENRIMNSRFFSTDLSEIKENLNLPYFDGIIGYDFFKNNIIEFDYPARLFKIHKNYESKDYIPFELFHNQIPKIKVIVDNIDGNFIIDTGDRTSLTIRRHFFEKLETTHYKLSDTIATGFSLGGPIMAQLTEAKYLKIGNLILSNIDSRIIAMKTGRFVSTDIDGSIGGEILKKFRVIIDYPRKRLVLLKK